MTKIALVAMDLVVDELGRIMVAFPEEMINEAGDALKVAPNWSIEISTEDYTLQDSDYTRLADGTSNTVTIKLPASPSHGQLFEVGCVNAIFDCTVGRNGKNIEGFAEDWPLVLNDLFGFHYHSTYGWKVS